MKDSDDIDFLNAMSGIKPLSQDRVDTHSATRSLDEKKRTSINSKVDGKTMVPLSMDGVVPVAPDDFLSYKQPGIQDGVFKNLRLGKYSIDVSLSLAGLTIKGSAAAVYGTLLKSHQKGLRAVLLRHGKGEQSKPFPGLKKSYVQHWLGQMDIVIAFHTAQPIHGGLGATYVLLKKHQDQKLINRELNRRK